MDSLTPPHVPVGRAAIGKVVLPSHLAYDLQQTTRDGLVLPRTLGVGRFAKVFAAQQRINGRPGRMVAIKVLHDHVDYQAERLFTQEIALNREFTRGSHSSLTPMLDTIELGPLVMCGCGCLYHPMCPKGCGLALQRVNQDNRPYPALVCTSRGCDYSISAEFVREPRAALLYSPHAKPCCKQESDPHASTGTIIHFVHREAMVMELLEMSVADYVMFSDETQPSPPPDRFERLKAFFGLTAAPVRRARLEQKVRLLAKVDLMVQIAETVAQLHAGVGGAVVIHKDIAPDNIMIYHPPCEMSEFPEPSPTRQLDRAANLCVRSCVIDYGLSDRKELSRSWYEDADLRAAVTKLPYFSPEARLRRQLIGPVEFDVTRRRFRVPAALLQSQASIEVNDIIADSDDMTHAQDVKVVKFETENGLPYAHFDGVVPKDHVRNLEIIRPLGEAHDVYALGTVLCYVLTGRHDEVENLGNLVRSIQEQPCPLETWHLSRRDNYSNRIRAIREPYWRDELMEVMIRAMVRGCPMSYSPDRTVRGPEPARKFLTELKQIQQAIMAAVFAEHGQARTVRRRRSVAGLIMVLLWALFGPGLPAFAMSGPDPSAYVAQAERPAEGASIERGPIEPVAPAAPPSVREPTAAAPAPDKPAAATVGAEEPAPPVAEGGGDEEVQLASAAAAVAVRPQKKRWKAKPKAGAKAKSAAKSSKR